MPVLVYVWLPEKRPSRAVIRLGACHSQDSRVPPSRFTRFTGTVHRGFFADFGIPMIRHNDVIDWMRSIAMLIGRRRQSTSSYPMECLHCQIFSPRNISETSRA
jgi:hypothetical protein